MTANDGVCAVYSMAHYTLLWLSAFLSSFKSNYKLKMKIIMEANENVKSVTFNWHQAGSTQDRDGAGENWERVTVGMRGVLKITEYIPTN